MRWKWRRCGEGARERLQVRQTSAARSELVETRDRRGSDGARGRAAAVASTSPGPPRVREQQSAPFTGLRQRGRADLATEAAADTNKNRRWRRHRLRPKREPRWPRGRYRPQEAGPRAASGHRMRYGTAMARQGADAIRALNSLPTPPACYRRCCASSSTRWPPGTGSGSNGGALAGAATGRWRSSSAVPMVQGRGDGQLLSHRLIRGL
jgi:hypothetical protein